MSFSSNLEQQIQLRGIGISELANRVGVSRQTVHAWLNGKPPAMNKMETIAKAVGCTVEDLLGEDKEDILVALDSAISGLTESNKLELLNYARYLKENQDAKPKRIRKRD